MPSLNDFVTLGQEVLEEFDNSTSGGTTGLTAKIIRYTSNSYNPLTGKFAAEVVGTYDLDKYTRTRSTVYSVGEQGAGSTRRVEEFFVTVAEADLVAEGWTAGELPDERSAFVVYQGSGDGQTSKAFPVVSSERVLKESLIRMKVRRDLGPTTTG